jgi:tRNA(fMet)-specific endonuclease VapC
MTWMLDTNTCIALINRDRIQPSQRVDQKSVDDVAISSVVLAELHAGVAKSERCIRNAEDLCAFLIGIDVMSFDEQAAAIYGAIRSRLERRGTPIGPLDLLIAAHAMSTNARLVTHNTREFERLADLQVEDWMEAS